MPTQLALRFDQVPVTCRVQERYHTIVPCLAGLRTPAEAAAEQNLGYSTVTRWLRDFRNDQKRAPLEVPGIAQGRPVEPTTLQQAFGQRYCQRRIDEHGLVRLGRWKIYVEEGLPKTPVRLSYWDGKLRADYGEQRLLEYQ